MTLSNAACSISVASKIEHCMQRYAFLDYFLFSRNREFFQLFSRILENSRENLNFTKHRFFSLCVNSTVECRIVYLPKQCTTGILLFRMCQIVCHGILFGSNFIKILYKKILVVYLNSSFPDKISKGNFTLKKYRFSCE